MNTKLVFICPYFGKLPNYFPIWLKTCEYNKDIDWLIFTDDKTNYHYPQNVKVNYITFYELKNYIEKQLSTNICLENPYKLCDFKPLYGEIFKTYIKEYDFWGHCDIDCIYGNIRSFITESILKKYDKILFLGHMTLYRNTEEVNNRYKIEFENISYKDIISSPKNFAFDESFKSLSMNTIYKHKNYPVYEKEIYFDICPLFYRFKRSYYVNGKSTLERKNNYIFEWKDGKLLSKNIRKGQIQEKEYAYVHFQKRKININVNEVNKCNHFILVPNEFIEIKKEITINELKKYLKRNRIVYDVYFKLKYKNFIFKLKKKFKGKLK